jgi:hypothetical protein
MKTATLQLLEGIIGYKEGYNYYVKVFGMVVPLPYRPGFKNWLMCADVTV